MACFIRMVTILSQLAELHGILRPAAVAVFSVMLVCCSPILSRHGFIPENDVVEKLRPGVHDRDSVTSLFGSPTTVADFDGEIWLYVKRESEQIAFLPEKLLNQSVLAVRFNKNGIVSGFERLEIEDGKTIKPVERKTLTRGRELGLIEQIIGNLGRFSNQNEN